MFWQMTLRASVRLSVEPLEEGYPLGEIGLGPGVAEPALARLAAGESVAQRGGAGVDLFHIPHGEGEAQRRRGVRQGREWVFPDEGRQQLDGIDRPGALLGEQQGGGRTFRCDVEGGVEQLALCRGQQPGSALALLRQEGEKIRGLVGVDAPRRCAELCVERGQGKDALPVQCSVQQAVKLGQWVGRVWLGHPEIGA